MEELRHALNAATNDPPPTGIDLDHLIAGERRRGRFQYRTGVAVGLTVLATGAVLVPTVLVGSRPGGLGAGGPGQSSCAPYSPGPGTPWPSHVPDPGVPSESVGVNTGPTWDPSVPAASRQADPSDGPDTAAYPPIRCGGSAQLCPELLPTTSPQPSRPADHPAGVREDCSVAVPRLSSALAVAMGEALPGWNVTSSVDPGNPNVEWVFLRLAKDSADGYVASLGLANGDQSASLRVVVSGSEPGAAARGCGGQHLADGDTCRTGAAGDILITSVVTQLGGGAIALPPGQGDTATRSRTAAPPTNGARNPATPRSYRVTDIRPDGTQVEVSGSTRPADGDGGPVLPTPDQLAAIAQSPGLTLFP